MNKITRESGGIKIIDEKGNKYTFGEIGLIRPGTDCHLEMTAVPVYSYNLQPASIESPTGNKIIYNYSTRVNSKYFTSLVQNKFVEDYKMGPNGLDSDTPEPLSTCYNYNEHSEFLVDNITLPNGQIDIIYNTTELREDLPGEKYVKQIILKDIGNHIIKNSHSAMTISFH